MNALVLARLQFAFTVAFHYIYPPLSIGLGLILVIMEGLYLRTNNPLYHQMTRFWVRIFGLIFAIGVATGVVMEFEFGTNWATYSRYVGDVFGSALASEGIFAFFLESGFLAILLFGWDKVPKRLHFISTILVAFGAHFSAVWITIANSWMQTPAGYHIVGEGLKARAEIVSFWAMVFCPSSMDRLFHVYVAAWATGAWLVISVSSFYLLKKRHIEFAKASIKVGLVVAFVATVGNIVTGDISAKGVARNQPEKLAAMEGVFEAKAPADIHIVGWIPTGQERVIGIKAPVPGLLSWLVYGDRTTPVQGLRSFPADERPPVNIVFQAYHGMVAVGVLLFILTLAGIFFWCRGTLFEQRGLLWIFVFAVLGPQLANQLGWITAEVGRQPWIVYRLLRTSAALSKTVQAGAILSSLIMFALIYLLLFAVFIYLLDHKIRQGPEEEDLTPSAGPAGMSELLKGHRA
jgi:cytochrome d ubiquinol oxidase subunit I